MVADGGYSKFSCRCPLRVRATTGGLMRGAGLGQCCLCCFAFFPTSSLLLRNLSYLRCNCFLSIACTLKLPFSRNLLYFLKAILCSSIGSTPYSTQYLIAILLSGFSTMRDS